MIELLAVLSASAAVGMRIAVPLLMIALLQGGELWSEVPILSRLSPSIGVAILVCWSLLELVASKAALGRRLLQLFEVLLSPLVGGMMGLVVSRVTGLPNWLGLILCIVGGLLALVLQLVQMGWSYRLSRVPIWFLFLQDLLCVLLVLFAFNAPQQGGLIALLLLWLAIRSSKEWHRWYLEQAGWHDRKTPRRCRRDPD